MDYGLAKELKEAGFDQPNTNPGLKGEVKTRDDVQSTVPPVYFPTLSELIEACGEGFQVLFRDDDGFEAESTGQHIEDAPYGLGRYVEQGKTPEEAVARLWLALNTDKDE